MKTKHLTKATNPSGGNSFRLLNAKGSVIEDWASAGCYGVISGSQIPKSTAITDVRRSRTEIPYTDAFIERYIYELNDMGFPISIGQRGATWHFHIDMANYKSKAHFVSTLFLIRMLWHWGEGQKVPDYFIQMIDADPTGNKIDKLQKAHKLPNTGCGGGEITYASNGINVDRKTLFDRFAAGMGVFEQHGYTAKTSLNLNNAWKGDLPEYSKRCSDCKHCMAVGRYEGR